MRQGTNASVMRAKNEKMILSMINKRPMSRADIAKETDLTKAAVTIIVDELIEKGFIIEREAESSGVGRKPLLLSFDGRKLFSVGINLTRKNVTVGISDFNGRIIKEQTFEYMSPEAFFGGIGKVVDTLLEECGIDPSELQGIGVVTPGPVDIGRGMILDAPNFDQWRNVPIVERLRDIFSRDVIFSSVSRASAIAQKYFGVARLCDNFAALLVDNDGIGSGIVLGGELFSGNNEIGHTSIQSDGIPCECGNRGCLEKYASLSAIIKGSTHESWQSAVDGNDLSIIDREAAFLSVAIINTANIFDIDMIVLCGDVCYKPSALIEGVQSRIDGKILCRKNARVVSGVELPASLVASAAVVDGFFHWIG